MAKIEMDISEYEVMKENRKLLENSLEKERGLQEQIKKLNDEKTKALEDAKMKVVKISKTEVTERLLRKKEDTYIWRELFNLLGLDYRTLPKIPDYIHTDHLIKVFFERATSHSTPCEETTTHGLDEIKAEIRSDLKSKMDEETIIKIKLAEDSLLKKNELIKENHTLLSDNTILIEKNKILTERCDELNNKLNNFEDCKNTLYNIREKVTTGYGFLNKRKFIDMVISILNK